MLEKYDSAAAETLTIEEVAAMLRIGRNTAYTMAQLGKLPTLRAGRKILVPRRALLAMLESPALAAKSAR